MSSNSGSSYYRNMSGSSISYFSQCGFCFQCWLKQLVFFMYMKMQENLLGSQEGELLLLFVVRRARLTSNHSLQSSLLIARSVFPQCKVQVSKEWLLNQLFCPCLSYIAELLNNFTLFPHSFFPCLTQYSPIVITEYHE